ncbi:permease prefix domain 1-containing protein [Cytobacillus spongiae]|jgi:cation transport ATPase|uniref:permease prefix domain 1-containing protein n=1 Tax=Cytobacillus spongiae TaxID=2901381 RepID=UPI001F2A39AD|nr:permease prefix domain 1-containing protein [Cytobacillus spongiae]UII56624.1 permease prefix domain 1-containing protein [Cytobacillus spongiae]
MKSPLEQYVKRIVQHTEGSEEEKEDLFEELLVHLELSTEQFMEEGFSQVEAEKKAMEQFGSEGEIGSQIQQSLFPYRKEMMLSLAISSILFSISLYTIQLISNGEAYIGWLVLSMFTSTMILIIPLNHYFHINRKRWMNGLLVVHILTYLYGYAIATYMEHPLSVGFSIWDILNIGLALILIYRTTLYDFSVKDKSTKILHGINITSGIFIIGASLFLIWGGLIMIGEWQPIMLLFASPIFIWSGLYFVQIKLAKKNRRIAFILGSIPAIGAMAVLLTLLFFMLV